MGHKRRLGVQRCQGRNRRWMQDLNDSSVLHHALLKELRDICAHLRVDIQADGSWFYRVCGAPASVPCLRRHTTGVQNPEASATKLREPHPFPSSGVLGIRLRQMGWFLGTIYPTSRGPGSRISMSKTDRSIGFELSSKQMPGGSTHRKLGFRVLGLRALRFSRRTSRSCFPRPRLVRMTERRRTRPPKP